MTLAYVFWHRPAEDVARSDYEERLRAFHATLESPSGSFRLHTLPWKAVDGYEDWYLVEDWAALGELNEAALAPARRAQHDAAAAASVAGWGGVYRLLHGASVRVLAGGDRRGGSSRGRRLPGGGVAEMGGQWAGPGQDKVLALAKELGVATFETYAQGDTVYYRSGRRSTYSGDIPPASPAA